jgi:AcrR family transcriptional regulator
MARPRKSDHTKQLLLTTGSQMLTEHGSHGTGIKQVLDAVGVPKRSFYNFFPSKEAYVASIIYHYGEQVAEEFNAATAGLDGEPALVLLWCSFRNKVRNKLASGDSWACLLSAMSAEIGGQSFVPRGNYQSGNTVGTEPRELDPALSNKLLANSSYAVQLRKLTTGFPKLDFMAMLDITWYEHQLARIGKGKATRPGMSAWTSVLNTLGAMGSHAFQRRRT